MKSSIVVLLMILSLGYPLCATMPSVMAQPKGTPSSLTIEASLVNCVQSDGAGTSNSKSCSVTGYENSTARIYLMFDFSPILGATVLSARLSLCMWNSGGPAEDQAAHMVTSYWDGTRIAWTKQPRFNSTATDVVTVSPEIGRKTWDVTYDVKAVSAGSRQVYGWVIRSTHEGTSALNVKEYRTQSYWVENERPKVEVTYVQPPHLTVSAFDSTGSYFGSVESNRTATGSKEAWNFTWGDPQNGTVTVWGIQPLPRFRLTIDFGIRRIAGREAYPELGIPQDNAGWVYLQFVQGSTSHRITVTNRTSEWSSVNVPFFKYERKGVFFDELTIDYDGVGHSYTIYVNGIMIAYALLGNTGDMGDIYPMTSSGRLAWALRGDPGGRYALLIDSIEQTVLKQDVTPIAGKVFGLGFDGPYSETKTVEHFLTERGCRATLFIDKNPRWNQLTPATTRNYIDNLQWEVGLHTTKRLTDATDWQSEIQRDYNWIVNNVGRRPVIFTALQNAYNSTNAAYAWAHFRMVARSAGLPWGADLETSSEGMYNMTLGRERMFSAYVHQVNDTAAQTSRYNISETYFKWFINQAISDGYIVIPWFEAYRRSLNTYNSSFSIIDNDSDTMRFRAATGDVDVYVYVDKPNDGSFKVFDMTTRTYLKPESFGTGLAFWVCNGHTYQVATESETSRVAHTTTTLLPLLLGCSVGLIALVVYGLKRRRVEESYSNNRRSPS